MLDAYIIQEIKRRELERLKQERARPTLELPLPGEAEGEREQHSERDDSSGGVIHIDL